MQGTKQLGIKELWEKLLKSIDPNIPNILEVSLYKPRKCSVLLDGTVSDFKGLYRDMKR